MTRAAVFTLLGFVLLTVSTPLLRVLGFDLVGVDVPAIIVVYLALGSERKFPSSSGLLRFSLGVPGAVAALLLGYLADVLGGGVKGSTSLALVLLYIGGRVISRQVALTDALSRALVTLAASVGVSLILTIVRWAMGVAPSLALGGLLLLQALLTAALAPPLMRLFRFVDSKLSRDSDARSSLQMG